MSGRPLRSRIAVRAFLVAGLSGLLLLALPGAARGADDRIRLPTTLDALPFAPGTETLLYGPQGIETQLPGPVSDEEAVRVDLQTDGSIAAVEVVQRLTVSGLGDFSFRVPGPAVDVVALPESANRPGLRRGSVLWQGFSSGTKLLAARMHLFPDQEEARLPLRFDLSMTVDGRPLEPGAAQSGSLTMTLRMSNVSGVPISISEAQGDPLELAAVLDAVHRSLRRGERPAPGSGGIPADVAVLGTAGSRVEDVEAPFRITGEVVFPPGTLTRPSVKGATASTEGDGLHVRFERLLGGGAPLDATIRIEGEAHGLELPDLTATASPATPRPSVVEPPSRDGWGAAVAGNPSAFSGSTMLALAMDVFWRVARLGQFDAYVGNPDPLGESTTIYAFRLAPKVVAGPAVAPLEGRVRPMAVLGLGVLLLVLLFGLALVWAHS